ncbi:MAG: hypothetical protein ACI8ZM_003347 [Crocinitomix sp.]|jgi:hypothetical protein
MKNCTFLFIFLISISSFSQKEKIEIPPGVVYKYCKAKKYQKAKAYLQKELVMNNPTYGLVNNSFFLGPVLWDRLAKVDSIAETKSTKVDLHVDQSMLEARFFSDKNASKVIWNHIRAEFNGTPMRLRKPTPNELIYYWTVISFDIEEPMIIAETPNHKYIIDIGLKEMSIVWLDEMPQDLKAWFDGMK